MKPQTSMFHKNAPSGHVDWGILLKPMDPRLRGRKHPAKRQNKPWKDPEMIRKSLGMNIEVHQIKSIVEIYCYRSVYDPLDLIPPTFPGRVATFLGRLFRRCWLLFPHNPGTVEVMPPQRSQNRWVQPERREETIEITTFLTIPLPSPYHSPTTPSVQAQPVVPQHLRWLSEVLLSLGLPKPGQAAAEAQQGTSPHTCSAPLSLP